MTQPATFLPDMTPAEYHRATGPADGVPCTPGCEWCAEWRDADGLSAEYHANATRFDFARDTLDLLRKAWPMSPPAARAHLDLAIAAAEGAKAGYSFRDDELYIEERARGHRP